MMFILHLLEIAQYSFLYSLVGLPLAYYNNRLYTPLDKNKTKIRILFECILQTITMAILFSFMKFIVRSVPFLFSYWTHGYKTTTEEYFGNAVSYYVMFFYLQIYLTEKLTYVAEQLFKNPTP